MGTDELWSVSQNPHFRLQPDNLTNTADVPVWNPSPCNEWNISFTAYLVESITLITGNITLALLNIDAVTVRHHVTYPSSYILGSRIKIQSLVEVPVIKDSGNTSLDMRKIGHHTVIGKLACTTIYGNNPIVPVSAGTFAFVRELKTMTPRYLNAFLNVIHFPDYPS